MIIVLYHIPTYIDESSSPASERLKEVFVPHQFGRDKSGLARTRADILQTALSRSGRSVLPLCPCLCPCITPFIDHGSAPLTLRVTDVDRQRGEREREKHMVSFSHLREHTTWITE